MMPMLPYKRQTMSYYTIYLIYAALIIGFISCTNTNNDEVNGKNVNIVFKKGKKLDAQSMRCYQIDDNTICIPSNWKLQNQNKYFLFSTLDNNDDLNSFFVIAKYSKITSGLSCVRYIKETYNELRKDTTEKLVGYTVKKLTFENTVSYYCEYYTSVANKPYLSFSTVFERNDNIFDVTLKTDSPRAQKLKESYRNVLFNLYHNHVAYFSEKDNVKNIEVIDLSKF
jgi:hypothetical protein